MRKYLMILAVMVMVCLPIVAHAKFSLMDESLYWSLVNTGSNDMRITSLHPQDEENRIIKPILKHQMIYNLGGIVMFIGIRALFESVDDEGFFPTLALFFWNIVEIGALNTWGEPWKIKVNVLNF